MEKFAIGLVVGGLAGAVLATNNYKMRTLVRKGQEEMQAKLDALMDEKIRDMDDGADKIAQKAQKTAEKAKEKAEEIKEKATKKKEEK